MFAFNQNHRDTFWNYKESKKPFSLTSKIACTCGYLVRMKNWLDRIVIFFLITASSVFALYYVYLYLNKPLIGTDDANILMEYARNFANGHGIVYNIGGEHVEGFSCFLYFLVSSFFYLFTPYPESLLLIFNSTLLIGGTYLLVDSVWLIAQKLGLKRPLIYLLSISIIAWLAINPFYFGWAVISLMDSGVYCFLIIFAFYSLIKGSLWGYRDLKVFSMNVSLAIFLLLLARPEGLLWGPVILLAFFFIVFQSNGSSDAKHFVKVPAVVYVYTVILFTLFRIFYFGYPLPNTFYTKVSFSFDTLTDGFSYLGLFISHYSPLILITLVSFLLIVLSRFLKVKHDLYLTIFSIMILFPLVGLVIPVLEGGDHFKGLRFYQNTYPLFILPLIGIILLFQRTRTVGIASFSIAVFFSIQVLWSESGWEKFKKNNHKDYPLSDVEFCIQNEFRIAENSRVNGERLNEIFKDELPVIGFGSAGGIAYGYDGIVYDMMGLNNTRLAHADKVKSGPKGHQAFNKKVFYELAPSILMPMVEPSETNCLAGYQTYYTNSGSWDNMIFKGLFNDPQFKLQYRMASVQSLNYPGYKCCGYFSNQFLQKLSGDQRFRIEML